MQCPACHQEVATESSFCNNCGTRMTDAASSSEATAGGVPFQPVYAAPASGAGTPPPGATGYQQTAASGLSDNTAAALSYLTVIPAIIFLVIEPYNRIPLVRFHSWQSIGLTGAAIALQIMVMIAEVVLHFIPGIILLFSLAHLVLGVGLFALWLYCILKASKGEWYKLPVVGDFAEKQARS